ncbi:hypothetical protein V2J09_007236 [Rumex salicifolius]
MAGFFSSLGSGSRETNSLLDNLNNPWNATSSSGNGMFLYRNEEIYQKGLEIWQQQSCFQFHHQQNPSPAAALLGPTGSGMSSLASTRCMMRSAGTHGGLGSGGGVNCQDCGNQAKKDCAHLRCRTCCKSRGFDCPTHVRSTWVPAAKRRERQQQRLSSTTITTASTSDGSHQLQIGVKSGEDDQPQTTSQKRQRNNYLTSTGFEMGKNLPSELSSTAVFRCVRVHSTDNADEQIAYQTAVNVGGRLFKGVLYDQGPEGRYATPPPGGGKQISACNLMIGAATATQPENSLLESNAMYSPPISAFLAGTQFFPTTPRS